MSIEIIEDFNTLPQGVKAKIITALTIAEGITIPSGGTKGQALIKNTTENYDATWHDIINVNKSILEDPNLEKDNLTVYQDYTNEVIEGGLIIEKTGYLLVFKKGTNPVIQSEFFFADEKIYSRVLDIENGEVIELRPFKVNGMDEELLEEKLAKKLDKEQEDPQSVESFVTFNNGIETPSIKLDEETTFTGNFSELKDTEFIALVDGQVVEYKNGKYVNTSRLTVLEERVNDAKVSYVFENEQQLENWLNGTYTRPDEITPEDLAIGNNIYLRDANDNDYWVSSLPVTSIENLSILENEKIDLTEYYTKSESDAKFLNKNQGEVNFGKFLKVGEDGNVETQTLDLSASGITTTHENNTLTNEELNVQADIDELDDKIQTLDGKVVKSVSVNGGTPIDPTSGNVDIVVNIPTPTVSLNGVDMLIDPAKTYLVIKTPADFDEFTLLTGTSGSPNYTIEWGDGVSDNITDTSNPTHIYEKAGMYLITISGSFANGIVAGSGANVNKNKMIEVYGGTNYPTSISVGSFRGCSSLTTANFPNVTSITNYAFFSCSSLTTANFPNVTNISNDAFRGCSSLTTANFPNVTSIGSAAFSGCSNLTTANFPNATSIGLSAFYYCLNLTTANFPNATSIGGDAFYECTSLTTANFPNATSIGGGAFSDCPNLTTANFPNVTSIDNYAFYGCTNLKHLTLGNVSTASTGSRFVSVRLGNLIIVQDVTDTDITRIKTLFINNGGTFSQSYEIKHGLQVDKTPVLDKDVIRKQDQTADKISYDNSVSGLVAENVQDAIDEISVSGGGGGIPEAPIDSKVYGRQDGEWTNLNILIDNAIQQAIEDVLLGEV